MKRTSKIGVLILFALIFAFLSCEREERGFRVKAARCRPHQFKTNDDFAARSGDNKSARD